ncbi:hypothetical protein PG985_013761 [Apiospora marii]|uniref:Uncharacterized protein n=1 Tax=Apiospora marii TaxID=335849 RepID=A0ABR1R6U9_9PEZI
MDPDQPATWPPGLARANVSTFNLAAALADVRGDKFSDGRWYNTLKHQCRTDFHFGYRGSAKNVSLLHLHLRFVADLTDLIGGWANEGPSRWDEIMDKLADNELNSVDDVLVDWKALFKGAIKKGDAVDLTAHLSKGDRARDTGFITFALPEGKDIVTEKDVHAQSKELVVVKVEPQSQSSKKRKVRRPPNTDFSAS